MVEWTRNVKHILQNRKGFVDMIKLIDNGVFLVDGQIREQGPEGVSREEAEKGTIAAGILASHNSAGPEAGRLNIRFDAIASHDITYVGIIQTARASGLKEFPVPYVLTNCHNSLCAVGGTINEDDHLFGLSAAVKYGGIYVPAHQAVIHQYMREMMAGCGKMIIGSDSHTRYGALGTMAVGEGGPELVKQLLKRPYELVRPEVVCVYLTGKPRPGVGPQDVALAIISAVFQNGFVKNKVMEFVGPGVSALSVDYRNGIDVMTTETTCWSSIWRTDEKVQEYYRIHGRSADFRQLEPAPVAYYDSCIQVDLSQVECMIALPFHPSNAYSVKEFLANAEELLEETERRGEEQYGKKVKEYHLRDKWKNGKLHIDQGVIAGCSGGTFENVCRAAEILQGKTIGNQEFALSVYPASQPVFLELIQNGSISALMETGATVRSAFCGPCFGAGDVPCNNGLSIRHTTRNFPNREGSKPSDGQISWVALMDARSIAATALNGGVLTAATDLAMPEEPVSYRFRQEVYQNRVYFGFGQARPEESLKFGPNIADWPAMSALTDNLLLQVACVIHDPVTTTDELIPSGETSSYRSNPLRLAEFTLSRKDPAYVGRAKAIHQMEQGRQAYLAGQGDTASFRAAYDGLGNAEDLAVTTGIGSVVFAVRPGDGSAREQAASCQKVLGGWANIAEGYATKRYRSNLINWGMLPFLTEDGGKLALELGDRIFLPRIREAVQNAREVIPITICRAAGGQDTGTLRLSDLSEDERKIILAGSLINFYNE